VQGKSNADRGAEKAEGWWTSCALLNVENQEAVSASTLLALWLARRASRGTLMRLHGRGHVFNLQDSALESDVAILIHW